MPKVSAKQVQRRIAELDAQYTVAQPKRPGRFVRQMLALIVVRSLASRYSLTQIAPRRTLPGLP